MYSYNTITGETELKEVTATFALESDHINYITIEDENGNTQTLEVTDVHPFWVVTDEPDLERAARAVVDENGVTLYHHNIDPTENGFWVEAKDLRVGDVFLGANGELTTVVAVERVEYPDGIMVYNFSVDGNHNYFVIAACDEYGQTSVLVHNASGNVIGGALRALGRLGLSYLFPTTAPEDRVRALADRYINMIQDGWRQTQDFIAQTEGFWQGSALQQVPPPQLPTPFPPPNNPPGQAQWVEDWNQQLWTWQNELPNMSPEDQIVWGPFLQDAWQRWQWWQWRLQPGQPPWP